MSDNEEDDVFGVSQELVPPAPIKSAGISSIDFDGLLSPPLKLHEDLKRGCGGQLWPAGMVMGKYMLRKHKTDLAGKTILELGAGGGLVGLAVALGCRTSTTLHITDQDSMLDLLKRNITLNGLGSRVAASVYEWGAATPSHLPAQPDVILAAECVYFEPAFALLQQTLKDLIGEHTVCYFCFKKRRRADLGFVKVAKKLFQVQVVEDDPDRHVYARENLFFYRITKKRG
ncbi:putative methyltransferase-domain-containing protein [Ampelomyces quisqualis]|uniref:Protein-lysine N-methyltransferase EFM6 n=1 Tax=Ampelomyces quisqualis TaxID=50730 RepID=A0A6A5R0Z7_AMPQU|nr:putative methyltransferase-domain-containing protein [Ampelomyces quisqualis]